MLKTTHLHKKQLKSTVFLSKDFSFTKKKQYIGHVHAKAPSLLHWLNIPLFKGGLGYPYVISQLYSKWRQSVSDSISQDTLSQISDVIQSDVTFHNQKCIRFFFPCHCLVLDQHLDIYDWKLVKYQRIKSDSQIHISNWMLYCFISCQSQRGYCGVIVVALAFFVYLESFCPSIQSQPYMGLVVRIPVCGVSDEVIFKAACLATETS